MKNKPKRERNKPIPTRKIDLSQVTLFRVDSKTEIYIDKNTSQEERIKIKEKWEKDHAKISV
jgi:hypothetical protein